MPEVGPLVAICWSKEHTEQLQNLSIQKLELEILAEWPGSAGQALGGAEAPKAAATLAWGLRGSLPSLGPKAGSDTGRDLPSLR